MWWRSFTTWRPRDEHVLHQRIAAGEDPGVESRVLRSGPPAADARRRARRCRSGGRGRWRRPAGAWSGRRPCSAASNSVRPVDWPGPPASALRVRSRRRWEYSSMRRSSAGDTVMWLSEPMAMAPPCLHEVRPPGRCRRRDWPRSSGTVRRWRRSGRARPSRPPSCGWRGWPSSGRRGRTPRSSISTGRRPEKARQSSTSFTCSATWMWMGASGGRAGDHLAKQFRRHRPQRMGRDADAAQRMALACIDRLSTIFRKRSASLMKRRWPGTGGCPPKPPKA